MSHTRATLFEVDEGVEIVSELVKEVCEVAFSIVYSHYLEEQAFPHSVDDAKHSLLKIIEVRQLGAKYKGRNVLNRTDISLIRTSSYIWFNTKCISRCTLTS